MSIDNADVARLDNRIDHLDGRVRDVENKIIAFEVIAENSTTALEKLTDTMESVKETMVEMNISLKSVQEDNIELKSDVKALKNKVNDVEDIGKFDIVSYVKQHFIDIVIACGLVCYIILGK